MPIDPKARAILDARAALGNVTFRGLAVEAVRAQQRQQSAALNRHKVPVGDVADRAIPGPAGDLRVRIYRPPGTGPAPILVYFHGGGFVVCDLDTHDNLCRALCGSAGAVLVSVDFRLAPEHPFPAAIDDALAAIRWASGHGGEVGGDPSRLFVVGDSAGGNLAASACLRLRDEGGPMPIGQAMLCPITTWRVGESPSYWSFADGYGLTLEQMAWFAHHYLGDPANAESPIASPLLADDLSGLPPALILTAEYDVLRDEAEQFAARLDAAGVPTTLRRYDGMIHGFARFLGILDPARQAIDEVGDWIGRRAGPRRTVCGPMDDYEDAPPGR